MIKAIIFDCFGVLATDTWQAFIDSLPDAADVEAAREAHRAYDAGMISKNECANQIKEATGKTFTELEDSSSGVAKNTELLRYISELRGRGYKTSILSNVASNWLRETFLSPVEQQLFDDYVLSYEVGMIKPEERMYTLATERLGVTTEEALLVDDKEYYCSVAQEVGLAAIQYKNLKQFKADLEKELAKHR